MAWPAVSQPASGAAVWVLLAVPMWEDRTETLGAATLSTAGGLCGACWPVAATPTVEALEGLQLAARRGAVAGATAELDGVAAEPADRTVAAGATVEQIPAPPAADTLADGDGAERETSDGAGLAATNWLAVAVGAETVTAEAAPDTAFLADADGAETAESAGAALAATNWLAVAVGATTETSATTAVAASLAAPLVPATDTTAGAASPVAPPGAESGNRTRRLILFEREGD